MKKNISKKKILFLLGTLEKSKCGVSDYTHMLVDRLSKEGHTCICVAINDRYLQNAHFSSYCFLDNNLFSYYRFSSSLTWKFRKLQLQKIIDSFSPSFISLQYVPYSFSDKGIPFQFCKLLNSLESFCDWHIMSHELWIMPKSGMLKIFVSFLQRQITLSIFESIKPKVLSVSNLFYQNVLSDLGFPSKILPLFSNIPCSLPPSNIRMPQNIWKFVSFGRLSDDWDYQYFFKRVESSRLFYGINECYFYLIGNCGKYGSTIWSKLAEQCIDSFPSFHFITTGPLSCVEISHHFHSATFGICTTPIHLVDKSGAAAAMIAHGLPVIVNPQKNRTISNSEFSIFPEKYFLLDENFERSIISLEEYRNPVDQLPLTAKQLVSDMNSACI